MQADENAPIQDTGVPQKSPPLSEAPIEDKVTEKQEGKIAADDQPTNEDLSEGLGN